MSINSGSVAIVGGGLVGSLLAVFLRRRGVKVRIYEKRKDLREEGADAGRSINLITTVRGIKALEKLDLWKRVKEICVPVFGRMMHDLDGGLTYQPYGKDDSQRNYSVSRSGINKLMLSIAQEEGAELVFEKEISELSFEEDVIIGADGSGSVVRKDLVAKGVAKDRVEWLGVEYKELLMPANRDGSFPMDKKALHIWPRGEHMLMALPNLDGSFTMTLYLPEHGELSFADVPVESYFQKNYPDSIPLMPEYLKDMTSNPVGKLGTVFCEHWTDGERVCLIGDAAHGVVPFFGQGMNCGFEDCLVFDQMMDTHDSWGEVFKAYSEARKPDTDAIARMAIANYKEMASKVADPKFLARKRIEKELALAFPGKFHSRYQYVVYSTIPYSEAEATGRVIDFIVDSLLNGLDPEGNWDQELAKNLIENNPLPAFLS